MKVTFIGGGSLRLLPILRGIFAEVPGFFRGGEIRLMDLAPERAEAVGRMILSCPEYADIGCKVIWTDDLDASLKGTDVLYLTMGARRQPDSAQAVFIGSRHGYFSSDNLSVNGAFLALRLGRTIFDIARRLEKLSPSALMLIFANPVAVYSHLVNTHTRIRALGICGGYNNHRYDLTRLCGRDAFDPNWNVVAAGVNHLSFILRGEKDGRDLFTEILPRRLADGWTPPEIRHSDGNVRDNIRNALLILHRMYRRYGTLIFSTEFDGLAHVFPDTMLDWQRKNAGDESLFDPAACGRAWRGKVRRDFANFMAASKEPGTVDWNAGNAFFGKTVSDVTVPIFRALGGYGKARIVATRPNRGAVRGFGDDMPLEYTMDIDGAEIRPVDDQFLPPPFFGLAASLSEFQRLVSEAIAARSPELFADALDAYPVHRFGRERGKFFREMFDLFSDIDPEMLSAKKYFNT
ncbi:MAG: hypothetical protein IJU70_03040 [Lentisphaeria bacterium]|nr:hypothetical protein [Lentisphaeria bacterium]